MQSEKPNPELQDSLFFQTMPNLGQLRLQSARSKPRAHDPPATQDAGQAAHASTSVCVRSSIRLFLRQFSRSRASMWTSRKTSESSPEKRIPETDHSVGGSATKTNSDPTEVEYTQKTMSTPNSRKLWTFLLLAFYLIDATGKKNMCICSASVSFWHLCLFCISAIFVVVDFQCFQFYLSVSFC